VPAGALVVGAPARVARRVLSQGQAADTPAPPAATDAQAATGASEAGGTLTPEGKRE
jgi:serine acetyltransferase